MIPLPRQYGPAVPAHVKRRVKYRRAPIASVTPLRVAASNAVRAYALYLEGSRIDDTDRAEGERLYRQALELDPTLALAWTNLGNLMYKAHRLETARAYYERAMALDPEQPEASYNLGYLELDAGNLDRAVELLERAVQLDPAFTDAWFNLGMAHWQALRGSLRAVRAFRTYLGLTSGTDDPDASRWREIARRHIG